MHTNGRYVLCNEGLADLMPEILHDSAVDSVHDPNKLQSEIDDHLNHLLDAERAEIPWFLSLYRTIKELVRPEKLPPLVVTSQPLPVKSIWSRRDARSRYASLGIHIAVFALLMLGATNKQVQKAIKQSVDLIDPNIKPFKPDVKPAGGGGGGGAREIIPVSKGQLPKPSHKQFVPPMITRIEHPKLQMDPSLVMPDVQIQQNNLPNWGDPLAKALDPSNGTGFGAGMGNGSGGGIGSGKGGGFGPGEGGGFGGGVFKVGNGVSQPQVIFKVDPEYSEEARKAKYSGTVMLAVIVDTEGHARNIRVVKSLGMGLDEKAIEAVEKWRFKPAMKGGQAVNVQATIEVNFRLL